MNEQTNTRRSPLRDRQNVLHATANKPPAAARKPNGVARDNTMIGKANHKKTSVTKPASAKYESSIPLPRNRRSTTDSKMLPAEAANGPPRQNVKPNPNAGSHRALPAERRRRTIPATVNFTSKQPSVQPASGMAALRTGNGAVDQGELQKQVSIANIMECIQKASSHPSTPDPSESIREQFKDMRQDIVSVIETVFEKCGSATPPETAGRITELVEENTRLKSLRREEESKSETLETDKQALAQERTKTKLENDRLNAQVKSLAQTLRDTEDSDKNNVAKVTDLQARLSRMDLEGEAFRTRMADFQLQADELQKQIRQRNATISSLEDELASMTAKARESVRKYNDVQHDLSIRDNDVRRLEHERDSVHMESDNLKVEIRSKSDMLRSHAEQLHEAQEAGKQLQHEFSNKLSDAQRDSVAQLTLLQSERDALKQSSDARTREVENQRAQIASLQEAVVQFEAKMNRMNADKLTQQLQADNLHGEVSSLRETKDKLVKTVNDQAAELVELQTQAREDAKMRRKLHNMIQELKGNIRVFCRVRPPLLKPAAGSPELYDYTEQGSGVVAKAPPREDGKLAQTYRFKFDKVFPPASSQAVVFEEISQLVQSALDGYRVCIFAYGQTGSGKTYTMLGQRSGESGSQLGMIPRAVQQVFDSAREMKKDGWKFKLTASFLEIYNESVRDLLNDGNKSSRDDYKLTFDNETKLCTVADMTIVDVESESHVQRLIEKSMRNRTTAATKVNERSSRSHSVFRLHIDGTNDETGQRHYGLLNLIDLAGSERLNQSKVEGERLRETKYINKSLSALGDVIAALANREKHVPFRNSKLTYLLQDSLGGDSKTLMFVNVSHEAQSFNESVCSLRFAAKVNSCHVGTATRSTRIEL